MAFLTTTTETITSADWKPLLDAVTGQINVSTVAAAAGAILGVGVGLAFFWWGGRKALRALMSAFKKGRLSV